MKRCLADKDCKPLNNGSKCIRGYCQLYTMALFEEEGREAAVKHVQDEKDSHHPDADRDDEILSLLLKPGQCNTNKDCVGGRICYRGSCIFKYLSLAHADEDYSES